jgi:carbon storage regulator CsrA
MTIVPTTQPPDPRGHLVLERQEGETLTIGLDIEVKVTRIVHGHRSKVFLRIVAPKSIAIMRAEAVLTAPRAHQPHLPSQR